MKILALIVLALVVAVAAGFFFLAQKSRSGSAAGLVDGKLAPCPASPNCVSSETGTTEKKRVDPLPASSWEKLPAFIEAAGGKVVVSQEAYIASEFSSKLMGFVDDVEFRKGEAQVHVRSASRVGYSDRGVNRNRVETLRALLKE